MEVVLKNEQLVGLNRALVTLGAWLKPGAFAAKVGQIRYALMAQSKMVEELLSELLELHKQYEGEGEEKKPKTKFNALAQEVFDLKDEKEYQEREKAIMDKEFTVTLHELINADDIAALKTDLRTTNIDRLDPVDFMSLLPVQEGYARITKAA